MKGLVMDQALKAMINRCFNYYFSYSHQQAKRQRVEYREPDDEEFINACGKIFYSICELVRLEEEWNHLTKLNIRHFEKPKWIDKKVMPVRKVTQRLIFKYIPHNPYKKYIVDNGRVIVNSKYTIRKKELDAILRKGIETYLAQKAEPAY